jgi:hypothetical protein
MDNRHHRTAPGPCPAPPGSRPAAGDFTEALRARLQNITDTARLLGDLADSAAYVLPLEWARCLLNVDSLATQLERVYADLAAPDPADEGRVRPWVPRK